VPELLLAERLRIRRSTLREVLRRLEGDGLLVANHSGGMRVVRLDREELVATLHVRAALEALSAGLAAERVRTGELPPEAALQLGVLADEADSVARTGAPEPATLADRTFHRAVDALAANGPCREALTRLWDRILVAAAQPDGGPAPRGGADHDHRGLLGPSPAGDGEAASALARRHVLAAVG
jgi:DNA-binding GntR family transcriptional regulator